MRAGGWPGHAELLLRLGWAATRNPRLVFRLSGVFLLRFADRQFLALLFQLPPRFTRLEPDEGPVAITRWDSLR